MDPFVIIGIIVGVIVLGAVFLIVVGLRSADEVDLLEDRLEDFAQRGESATLEEIELSQTFTERVILPVARRLGEFAIRFTPQNALDTTTYRIEQAGNPRGLDATIFWALRFGGVVAGTSQLVG